VGRETPSTQQKCSVRVHLFDEVLLPADALRVQDCFARSMTQSTH
jgi:hypothetical protein